MPKARFEEVYREGKRVVGELCRLMALPGSGRIGFATPRAAGSTPRRNRMKRRFRAAVEEIGRPSDLDLVISISQKSDRAPYGAIRLDLTAALRRMNERWAKESESP